MTFAASWTAIYDRLVAMQALAVTETRKVYDYIPPDSSPTPYWTNRMVDLQRENQGTDMVKWTVQIEAALVMGYVTEGYDGKLQEKLRRTTIPDVISYFEVRPRMTYTGQATPPVNLKEMMLSRNTGVRIAQSKVATSFIFTFEIQYRVDRN